MESVFFEKVAPKKRTKREDQLHVQKEKGPQHASTNWSGLMQHLIAQFRQCEPPLT